MSDLMPPQGSLIKFKLIILIMLRLKVTTMSRKHDKGNTNRVPPFQKKPPDVFLGDWAE